MAKVRIYALAKELEVQSKDIIHFLTEKNIEIKSPQSTVDDEIVTMVKNNFMTGKKSDHQKVEEKTEIKPEEQEKKKSNISVVYHPQNSKMAGKKQKSQRQNGNRNHSENGKNRRLGQNTEEEKAREQKPAEPDTRTRTEKKEAIKASFDRILGEKSQKSEEKAETAQGNVNSAEKTNIQGQNMEREKAMLQEKTNNQEKTEEKINMEKNNTNNVVEGTSMQEKTATQNKTVTQEKGEFQSKNNYRERNTNQDRNRGQDRTGSQERGKNQDRQQRQDRGSRPDRNYQQRYTKDRPNRNDGEKNYTERSYGDRNNTDRNYPDRNNGDRNNNRGGQNNRQNQNGNRPQGNRGNSSFSNNRGKEQRNRLEQEITKMNQNTPPVMEETRKDTRDRRGNNNQKQDKNREFVPKKQERFMNLEKNNMKKKKQQPAPAPAEKEEVIKNIIIPEQITIKDLADKMKVQAAAIVKKLFLQGVMVTVNQEIDFEKAEEIALEFNCICELEEKVDVIEELLREEEEDESKMVKRPPVVCVMGHVDHGKTSLLDAIRNTHVIDKEAGGITQHIGAYMVKCNGEKITFLDTPGHEAFTAMRMRGANATDIAILVVAADDGVMPQTVEAISHARAAGVEIIVAINKIDKPSANIDRVKQELSEHELIPEDWGGSTIFVPVSAHTHEGIDNLLEMILLTAEISELKANPKRQARGLVIEAQLDKGRGVVATVLVQKGTLKVGQPIAAGSCSGKVRAMIDDKGRRVKEAGPSTPVEILGLNNVPNAGEVFVSTNTDKEAKNFADTFISQGREKLLEDTKSKLSLDDLFSQIQSGNVKELNLIVKADVQGSVEAVKQSLQKLSNEEVVVKIIHGGVGAINESDVSLASASNAIIIGFNIRPDVQAKASAEREGVDLRLYKVIYNAIEDVQAAMKGMLDPVFEEKVLGHAEVRQIFKASGIGNIAGSYILDGIFQRGCKVRISREGEQIFEGNLASLKRFKDDVKEVRAGYECGLVFEGFNDIQELDVVEAYTMVEVPR